MVTGGFLIGLAISMAISFALSFVSGIITKLLTKKPKKDTLGFDDRTDTSLGVIDPQEFFFGELRKGGTIVYKRTTPDKHDMWLVIAIAGHECEALDELWLGNEAATINSDGSITSLGPTDYSTKTECFIHLGTETQTVDTDLQAVFPEDWTDDHRLAGITYAVCHFTFDSTLFGGGVPNPSFRGRGYNQIYDPRTGMTGYTDNSILCTRAYLLNTVFGPSIPVMEIDDVVSASEASICDEATLLPAWADNFVPFGFETATNISVTSLPNDILQGSAADWGVIADFQAAFATGTAIVFSTTITTFGGIIVGTVYYTRITGAPGASRQFKVYPTSADAFADTNQIDITAGASGVQTMTTVTDTFEFIGRSGTFTASASTNLITPADFFANGSTTDSYAVVVLTTTITLPGGTDSTTKYLMRQSAVDRTSGLTPITDFPNSLDITSAGTGIHTLTIIGHLVTGYIGPDNVIILKAGLPLPGLYVGKPLRYHDPPQSSGSRAIVPELTDGEVYYVLPVIVGGATCFRVAATADDARVGKFIVLPTQDTVSSLHRMFETLEVTEDEVLNCSTGAVVQLDVTDGNSAHAIPAGFSKATDYVFVYAGRGRFRLASSLANAFTGTTISMTDNGTDTNLTYRLTVKSERRYVAAGVWDADQEYGDVLKGLLSSCAGRFVPPGDMWRLYAGSWRVPLVTLDRHDVRTGGTIKLQMKQQRRDLINTVQGTFASPANFDQPSNFPTISDNAAIAEDGSQILASDIQLPFTGSKWTAVRLALIEERRGRYQAVAQFDADVAMYDAAVNDNLMIDFAELNIADKFFELAEVQFGVETVDDGEGPILVFDMTLRETHPFIYMDSQVPVSS